MDGSKEAPNELYMGIAIWAKSRVWTSELVMLLSHMGSWDVCTLAHEEHPHELVCIHPYQPVHSPEQVCTGLWVI